MIRRSVWTRGVLLGAAGLWLLGATRAEAQAWGAAGRRGWAAGPSEPTSYPMLGTFYPSPYTMVRGNYPAGGGYSPLETFGDQTLVMFGSISSFRATSAPVQTYARGYDGRPVVVQGTSFSTPNQPELTPVIYPTQATYYYGPRQLRTPPWWANGINWVDQN